MQVHVALDKCEGKEETGQVGKARPGWAVGHGTGRGWSKEQVLECGKAVQRAVDDLEEGAEGEERPHETQHLEGPPGSPGQHPPRKQREDDRGERQHGRDGVPRSIVGKPRGHELQQPRRAGLKLGSRGPDAGLGRLPENGASVWKRAPSSAPVTNAAV